jgi:hypothetical protein
MKQPECHEGPEALKRFEQGMTALFQVKKSDLKEKPKAERKQDTPGKD